MRMSSLLQIIDSLAPTPKGACAYHVEGII